MATEDINSYRLDAATAAHLRRPAVNYKNGIVPLTVLQQCGILIPLDKIGVHISDVLQQLDGQPCAH